MPARKKLNSAYFTGCLALSTLIGLVTQSVPTFLAVLAVTVGASVHSGGIRAEPIPHNRHRSRYPTRRR